ncbi:hypothetical protein [Sphingomonas sp. BK235]|uniref:hypothetical protein n=1 Tax=Sphingomonas sp. BK235 TaxID=2512131 RepID=UPI00104A5372|nr:hypothetical protein [Sphingomonas sp. BK235]TCP33235.1 hypothetical protein EV292_106177 [Sphingomonas sp. BK235]
MGIGNDTYFVDRSDFSIDEQPDGGFDTVLASVDYTLPANVEAIKLVGNATSATGNALNNYLYSNSDKNFSTLIGGDGDDTYFVSYPGARVVEQQGKAHGNDVIYSSYEFDLFNTFVETLVLTGSALSAKGNAQGNILIGNDSFNFLDGRAGADTMIGGKGDDSYRVDNVGDKIIEKQGKAEGRDFVASSVNYDLAGTFVEHLFLSTGGTHGYGNSQDNTLSSALGDNYLTGRGGNDIFSFAGDLGA